MTDATGRMFSAKIESSLPIAEGWVEYEIEVSPEADLTSLKFVDQDADGPPEIDSERCPEKRFVGTRLQQCFLAGGHFGPHQFQL